MTEQGLSILIPQFNQEITALLERLEASIPKYITYEVVVANDNDQTSYPVTQDWLNTRGFRFIQNTKNLGRSKNRNQLADESRYDLLLFMDEDMMPKNSACIERYHSALQNNDVVVGGHIYEEKKPNSSYLLHWRYGNTNESKTSSNNEYKVSPLLSLHRFRFNAVKLNESIRLRSEDSLFGTSLEQHNYQIQFNIASITSDFTPTVLQNEVVPRLELLPNRAKYRPA